MSRDAEEFASGGRRTQPRSQRKPAGGGEGCSLPDEIPSPAVSVDPTPMKTHLEALDRQREENGGWLVPPPPEHVLRGARKVDGITRTGSLIPEANDELNRVCTWFEALFDAGATRHELCYAITYWVQLGGTSGVAVRHARDNCITELERRALKRAASNGSILADEGRPAELLSVNRAALAQQRRELREAEEKAQKLRKAVQHREAVIDGLLQQYPHLQESEERAA